MISVSLIVSLFNFCLDDVCIGESELFNFQRTMVWQSLCVLGFSKVSSTNVNTLALAA